MAKATFLLAAALAVATAIPVLRRSSQLSLQQQRESSLAASAAQPEDTFLDFKDRAVKMRAEIEDGCNKNVKFVQKTLSVTVGDATRDISVYLHCGVDDKDPRYLATRTAVKAFLTGYPAAVPQVMDVHIHEVAGAKTTVSYAYKDAAGGDFKLALFLGPLTRKYVPMLASDDKGLPRGGLPQGSPTRTVGDQVYDYFTIGAMVTEEVALGSSCDTKVMHEVCHAIHEVMNGEAFVANIKRNVKAEKQVAYNGVSFYAGQKQEGFLNEFVAEVCAAKIAGITIPDYAETLYSDVGGPVITDEMKLIKKVLKSLPGSEKYPPLEDPNAAEAEAPPAAQGPPAAPGP